MNIENQSIFRIFLDAIFFSVVAACSFLGSRLLISIAPWRETEIYVVAAVAFVGGLVLWVLVRRRLMMRNMLVLLVVTLLVFLAWGNYKIIVSHYEKEFPLLERHVDIYPASRVRGTNMRSPQDALFAHVQQSPAFRSRLFGMLVNTVNDKNLLAEADAILASRYQFINYASAQLPHDLSWKENPYDDPSWNWRLHNMEYVVTLARAYERTGNQDYLQRAEELILDWIHDNTRYLYRPPSEFSWGDHSTAFRLMNWLYFFDVWKGSNRLSLQKTETIFRSMLGHASRLADDEFYFHRHNHGIDQDRALLALSLMHPYVRQASLWRDLALNRLVEQARFAVSPQGIHLEHSPDYHLYGLKQLQSIHDFVEQWQMLHPFIAELGKITSMMAIYVPYIVKPNGYLAQIGDTGPTRITGFQQLLAPLATGSPLLMELIDTGSTQHLGNVAQAFKEEGYAIIRDFANQRLSFKNSFYLFLTAGAHEGRGHRQADDLSFILSHAGRDLLVDSGYYSYKADAGRAFVLSAAAHNTVVLDGASYKGWATRFDAFRANDRYTLIHASHRNYPGFEHNRWLLHLRPGLVFVVDRMRPTGSGPATTEHRFEQLFHFAPDLNVEIDNTGSSANILHGGSANNVLRIVQLGETNPTLRVVKGQKEPMQGWHSPEHAKLVPAPALISRLDGRSAQFITVLELPDAGAEHKEISGPPIRYQAVNKENMVCISWSEGRKIRRLTLNTITDEVTEQLNVRADAILTTCSD